MIKLLVKEAKNIKEKVVGLINAEKPYALLLKTRFGIHTFGLKFPIDVVILDNNSKVVKIKKALKPNSIFLWNPSFGKVLELPKGIVDQKRIKIKSKIRLLISSPVS